MRDGSVGTGAFWRRRYLDLSVRGVFARLELRKFISTAASCLVVEVRKVFMASAATGGGATIITAGRLMG